ncbi:MAG: formylmethanofuran dehydrogenase subunit E family protein [Candidatus Methanomethylophilaceae archaeon]|nr:formylmethanofuran dehydrogenase subunit E family protein [Candidatus Methanomethylophilaceae archaeon]
MEELPLELRILKSFHGHLGPYVVLGYKMGRMAREKFPEKIYANVYTGNKPPLSCLVDGIQMSSSCTLGKGNITVNKGSFAMANFMDEVGNKMVVELKKEMREKVDREMAKEGEEERSLELFLMDNSQLFDVTQTAVNRPTQTLTGRR